MTRLIRVYQTAAQSSLSIYHFDLLFVFYSHFLVFNFEDMVNVFFLFFLFFREIFKWYQFDCLLWAILAFWI